MMVVVIALILLIVVAVAALAVVLMWLVKSRYRDKEAPPVIEAPRTAASKAGTCSRCGEQRIIVSESDGMCASCYSALRTKAP